MNELQIIKGVECYIDANGIAQLNLEQVAKGLGFTQTQDKGGKEYTSIRWETINRYCSSFGFPNILGKGDFIPEPIFYLLAMKADNQTAREFQKLVAYDILPSIRKHGLYAKDELLDNPELLLDIVTKLTQERTKNKQLAADIETLQIKLDTSKDWYSIKRIAALNGIIWKSLDWRKLKQSGKLLGLEVRKIFDANYGEVNVYHKSAWEAAYPQYEL